MSDTPRTDAIIDSCGDYEKPHAYIKRLHDFARGLERELQQCAAAHKALVQLAGGPPLPGHSSGTLSARTEERAPERWTEAGEAAFEKWWQTWRQQNAYPDTQRMRDAARSVYESLTSGSIDTMVEQLREQGQLSPQRTRVFEPITHSASCRCEQCSEADR